MACICRSKHDNRVTVNVEHLPVIQSHSLQPSTMSITVLPPLLSTTPISNSIPSTFLPPLRHHHRTSPFLSTRTPPNSPRLTHCVVRAGLLPVDPWAPGMVDSQSLASQLFAFSLFPYLGFLYFLTRSKSAPKLTLFGFYFLLAFVGATIPAGIYAKVHYGTSLSNVDWLHGGAESLLTITNLFIVLGLRDGLRKAEAAKDKAEFVPDIEEK